MIIILYVMDSLRPDYLSCYGCQEETSPNIDSVARDGVLFTNAFSQSTWTRAVGASLLTALFPTAHGVCTHDDHLVDSVPMVQETLRSAGFTTMAVTAMGNISPYFGFGRGFDHFVELYKEPTVMEKRKKVPVKGTGWEIHFHVDTNDVPIATSEDINDYVLSFLPYRRQENVFILVWSIDTHAPYFHRNPFLQRFAPSIEYVSCEDVAVMQDKDALKLSQAIYKDMIYFNDYHIGALVNKLKEMGLYDEMFFVITGDHGEAFGEHGLTSHGKIPYDEQIRVPLILKFPFSKYKGINTALVQHVDAMPTIYDYLNIPNKTPVQGESMLKLFKGHKEIHDCVFTEYHLRKEFPSYVALRTHEYKYIAGRRPKLGFLEWVKHALNPWPSFRYVYSPTYLFDLIADPLEKANVVKSRKGVVTELHSMVKTFLDSNEQLFETLRRMGCPGEGQQQHRSTPDQEVAKQLKALGYFDEERS